MSESTGNPKTPQVIVHHLNDSRSQRILWLLEELNVPYTIKHYKRVAGRAPKELEAIHPLGKSPVITVDGKAVLESGAIVEYLIEKFGNGKFVPISEDGKQEDRFWSHFAEGSCMNWLVMKLVFTMAPAQSPWLVRPLVSGVFGAVDRVVVAPELKKLGTFITDEIKKKNGDWLAGGDADGNPTTGDFQMMFVVEAMASGRLSEVSDEIKAYVKKIHDRPGWRKGLEKGGEYSLAGKL